MAGGSDGWESAIDEVAALVLVDAAARVLQRGVSVTLEGEQVRVSEFADHGLCSLIGSGRIVGVADHEDRVRGGAVPRAGVGVACCRWPCGTRLGGPCHDASDVAGPDVAELLLGVVRPRVARVGTLGASDRVELFGSRIGHGARRGRGFLRGAMLPQILQLGGQGAPLRVHGVEVVEHGADGLAVGPGALRVLLEAPEELVEFGVGRVRGPGGEGAAVGGGAPAQRQELIQGRGRAQVDVIAEEHAQAGFPLRAGVHSALGVVVAVQDHGAHLVGEEIGVGRAQECPVGDPEIAELLVAHGLPELVEITGCVGGGDQPLQVRITLLAAQAELGIRPDPGPSLPFADREREGKLRLPGQGFLRAVETAHGGALTHPSRIPADDVEALPYFLGEQVVVFPRQRLWRAAAGAAGVEEERADALSGFGRLSLDDRKLDRAPLGIAVVQRHLRGRAVEALLTGSGTGLPVKHRHGRLGRGGCRPGGSGNRLARQQADEHHGSRRDPPPAHDLTCIGDLACRNQTAVRTDLILCKTKVAKRNRGVAQAEAKRER